MSVHHITLTLGAGATAISTPTAGQPSINTREVHVEPEGATDTIFVGGSTVSSTDYGAKVVNLTGQSPTTLVMRQPSHTLNLASIYVAGTQGNKVHILYVQ